MLKYEQEVKNYLIENQVDGVVKSTFTKIAKGVNTSGVMSIIKVLDRLDKDRFIKIESRPMRGKSNADGIFRIVGKETEIKMTERKHEPDIIEVITEQFEWLGEIEIMENTSIGSAIDIEILGRIMMDDLALANKIIKSNKTLFENNMIELDGKTLINRTGILTVLLKTNIENFIPIKKTILHDFQSFIINHMSESIFRARVVLTDDDKIKIRTNLLDLADDKIDKEEISNIFHDLESDIENLVSGYKSKIVQTNYKLSEVEKDSTRYKTLYENQINNREPLLEEIRELKGKLLARS